MFYKSNALQRAENHSKPLRKIVANNPGTPSAVLALMAKLEVSAVLERIAEHPRTPVSTLYELSAHRSPEVRAAVASNINCPIDLIWKLAADEDVDTRYYIAENPHIPPQILARLTLDENPYIAMRAQMTLSRCHCELMEKNTSNARLFVLPECTDSRLNKIG